MFKYHPSPLRWCEFKWPILFSLSMSHLPWFGVRPTDRLNRSQFQKIKDGSLFTVFLHNFTAA